MKYKTVSFISARATSQSQKWDLFKHDFHETLKNDLCQCAWSPNGKYLATGSSKDGTVLVWDMHDIDHIESFVKTTVKISP